MKAKAEITKKVKFTIEQEGTISGELSPGECKYHLVSRVTGIYLVIISMNQEGEIKTVSKRVRRK